jgi:ATP/maltotriose-dependent transcriptional regulator MalT
MFAAQHSVPEYRMSQPASPARPAPPPLSTRELQALELIARGFSYSEISRLQEVSVHTTRSHIKNAYAKLNVHSKNEAVFEATMMGLLRPLVAGVPYHERGGAARDNPTNRPEPGTGAAGFFDRA